MFGLTNSEGNHGEDVKELYYYLDGTPTHSYMRMLYKYPQAAFPYERLVEENAARGRDEPEFELIDTGVFDDGRYFDVTVEYAKAAPDDILMRITVAQSRARGRRPACAAAALGAQHLGLDGRGSRGRCCASATATSPPCTRACRRSRFEVEADGDLAVLRERDQLRSACSASGRARSVQGRHQRLSSCTADGRRRPSSRARNARRMSR